MNLVAYALFCSGVYLGVSLGDPSMHRHNKWDELAVSLVILGFVVMIVDVLATLAHMGEQLC